MRLISNRLCRAGIVLAAGVSLLGCGGAKAYVRPGFLDHPPRRVAVLPFVITYAYDLAPGQAIPKTHELGKEIFRKTLYYGLTPYGYDDIALTDVDARLTQGWGPLEREGWRKATPQELGGALNADALIFGELHRLMHFTTPLYTETSLEASLRMVEASTGEVLWRTHVRAAERGGALMKKGQVVDFVKDQVRSFNPSVKFLRVSDVAVRQALRDLPDPPMTSTAADDSQTAQGGERVRIALLPFAAKRPQWQQAGHMLRQGLDASLQDSSFGVVEPGHVDAALYAQGWTAGAPLPAALSLSELGKVVGADLFIRGTVTDWGRTYAVVESWVKAELQLDVVEASSGEVIWSEKKRNTRQAGLLKGPTGYQSVVTAPILGLKTSNLEEVATHLTRTMARDLSASPALLAYVGERQAPGSAAP